MNTVSSTTTLHMVPVGRSSYCGTNVAVGTNVAMHVQAVQQQLQASNTVPPAPTTPTTLQ